VSQKITIVAVGSRGDIQPYCALALGLKQRNYRVQIATSKNFRSFVENLGIDFSLISGDYQELLATEQGLALLEGDRSQEILTSEIRYQQMLDAYKACESSKLILFNALSTWVYSIVEKLEVPGILLSPVPIAGTRAFPFLNFARSTDNFLLGIANLASYRLAEFLFWKNTRQLINQFRTEELGLSPLPYLGARYRTDKPTYLSPLPIVHHYSQAALPSPPDWSKHIYQTGYWFLNESDRYQPPEALKQFLLSGKKPIYIGFGSMMVRAEERTRLSQVIIKAIELSRQRAIMASGWGSINLDTKRDEIFLVDEVPHDWLFPQVAAAVYHGAAGTTAAALRAGIPSIVVPFFADQPIWGERLHLLGVAPKPIPRKELTAEALAQSIQQVTEDKAMLSKSARLGEVIRAEDGIARAIKVIEKSIESSQH
jgi:UDP:flavonoid glycosyltransferase YjiC (YdhE family)